MTVKNVERKDKDTTLITVEIDSGKFGEAVNSAYKKNKNKITVPGFRKGKAPLKLIESIYGASVFYEDAVDILAPEAYTFALEQEKLNAVGRPSIDDVKFGDDKTLTLTFKTALYPEVNLLKYKGLASVKSDAKVTDEEVAAEIEKARSKNSRLVTVEDREASINDTAVIDFEGSVDGKPFEGGKAEKYSLKLGSNSFIPGFEEQVAGMKPGEEKDINVTFPADYTPELAGKDAVFKVRLHEIKETILPELDDEFAKDVSEYDTLEEYKKSVRDRLAREKEDEAKTVYRQGIMEQLVNNLQAEIPEAMIDEQLEKMVEDYAMRMQAQGMALDAYLDMIGVSREDFLKSGRPTAENQVKVTLALRKVIELENIEATEDEIEAEYKKLSENYKVDLERVKAVIPPEQMKNDIKMMKAEELVCSSGVAINAEQKEKDEDGQEAAEAPKKAKTTAKKPAAGKTAKKAEEKKDEE